MQLSFSAAAFSVPVKQAHALGALPSDGIQHLATWKDISLPSLPFCLKEELPFFPKLPSVVSFVSYNPCTPFSTTAVLDPDLILLVFTGGCSPVVHVSPAKQQGCSEPSQNPRTVRAGDHSVQPPAKEESPGAGDAGPCPGGF